MLEEGPQKNWCDEDLVTICFAVSVLGGILFFWRAFTARQPIVDLSAFKDRNFAFGSLFSFVMGVGLYGLTYVYPIFLARVRGYNSLQIGETMFVSGLCMFVAAPVVGKLMRRVDPRLLIGLGFAGFALGTWMASGITKDWDFWELLVPQMLRGFSLMTAMVPINNVALGTLPPARLKNASGLYNLTRNFGGAVGRAGINTLINDRWRCRSQRLFITVLIMARPTAPPKLRVRLNSPDAFFSLWGGTVPRATLLIGTIAVISEKPRRTCGTSNSQKSQSAVIFEACQVPIAKPVKPIAMRIRGSTLPMRRPTMGAATNMQSPDTNMVSPICSEE